MYRMGNFHVSCYVSRAFQILCDEVLCGMNWANSTQIEEIRELVEKKFKVRLLSVIDKINVTKDNVEFVEDSTMKTKKVHA